MELHAPWLPSFLHHCCVNEMRCLRDDIWGPCYKWAAQVFEVPCQYDSVLRFVVWLLMFCIHLFVLLLRFVLQGIMFIFFKLAHLAALCIALPLAMICLVLDVSGKLAFVLLDFPVPSYDTHPAYVKALGRPMCSTRSSVRMPHKIEVKHDDCTELAKRTVEFFMVNKYTTCLNNTTGRLNLMILLGQAYSDHTIDNAWDVLAVAATAIQLRTLRYDMVGTVPMKWLIALAGFIKYSSLTRLNPPSAGPGSFLRARCDPCLLACMHACWPSRWYWLSITHLCLCALSGRLPPCSGQNRRPCGCECHDDVRVLRLDVQLQDGERDGRTAS